MTIASSSTEHPQLVQWYEDLRAQATGQVPPATPRGLNVLLNSGLSSWIEVCPLATPHPAPAVTVDSTSTAPVRPPADTSAELVAILTEMALGGLRRFST